MVALKIVQTSIEEFKPKSKGFVGVFIGGTSGIGEAAVIGFAKHVEEARLYIVGRNEEAAKSIIARCEKLSPSSKFTFFQQDLALLKDVDKVCAKIQQAEEKIDLLFMTPGYLSTKGRNETAEGIDKLLSLRYYGRMRATVNLLPQLLRSPAPRVISCFAPGMEGTFLPDDLGLKRSYGIMLNLSHVAIMTDLFFESLAERHPTVSFLHVYPGNVITPEFDRAEFPPLLKLFVRYVGIPLIRPFTMGYGEVGERMVFHARSARYPPKAAGAGGGAGDLEAALLKLPEGLEVIAGMDGEVGSGAYCVSATGDRINNTKKLKALREHVSLVWEHTMQVFAEATAT